MWSAILREGLMPPAGAFQVDAVALIELERRRAFQRVQCREKPSNEVVASRRGLRQPGFGDVSRTRPDHR